MIGYKLTHEQVSILIGKKYDENTFYNPVQDVNGDWFIFEHEYQNTPEPHPITPTEFIRNESEAI